MMGTRSHLTGILTFALTGLGTACATVGQDTFDTEIAALRNEMAEGDRRMGRRTDEQMVELSARLDRLTRELAAFQSDFDVAVERLETAIRFNVPVYFGFDEATLRSEDRPILDRFTSVVNEYYPEALLTVEGFTDPLGSAEYNLRLGLERAETIRGYLIESGEFAQDHIRAVSYGEDSNRLVLPGRGGETAGWQNRRVVLVVEHLGSLEDATLVAGTP